MGPSQLAKKEAVHSVVGQDTASGLKFFAKRFASPTSQSRTNQLCRGLDRFDFKCTGMTSQLGIDDQFVFLGGKRTRAIDQGPARSHGLHGRAE